MKKIIFISLLLTSTAPKLFSQERLKKALDDFHYTLAFTYHPMVDDSDFSPIRKRSAQLAKDAAEVKRVSDSLGIKSPLISKGVNQLTQQCRTLDEAIQKNATDDVVREQLTAVHSKFHELEEMVNGGEE